MEIIQTTNKIIIKIKNILEKENFDSDLKYFVRILESLKEELTKPEISTKQLSLLSYAMTRFLQESNWDNTSLGEEIWKLLAECRKYEEKFE